MTTTPIPQWAAAHLKNTMPAGIVNATNVGSRSVLANTRLGAVLVRKSLFGTVEHVLLEVPRARLRFPCSRCQTTINVFETRGLPAVKCESCSATYRIGTDGSITDAMGVQVRVTRSSTSPESTAPPSPPRPRKSAATQGPDDAPAVTSGTYQHNGYWLHVRWTKSGAAQYFFAKAISKSGEPCNLPSGFEVGANSRTGLPFLRRAANSGGKATAKASGTRGSPSSGRRSSKKR